jgi:hypothetical protein
MNITDTHVSANNPFISHQGPRDVCQFHDCIARRVRYVILIETEAPSADVARLQRWLPTATERELHIARLVARERDQFWAETLLEDKE